MLTLLIFVILYMLPTFVAMHRRHHNTGAILVVNLFLGWTAIGWIVALAMAAGEVHQPRYR